MKYIIYKTTNSLNNNIYIGQHATEDINDNYLGSGVALLSDIKKYGKYNFKKEILYIFDTREKNPMCTKVIRLKDLKIYNTMQECTIDNNISTRTIYAHCKKTLKNKNSEFMYYNDFVKESKNE